MGADTWRRTGVLTFDGNCRVKEKVTYRKIQQHLQEVYDWKFSYGTIVQLQGNVIINRNDAAETAPFGWYHHAGKTGRGGVSS